MHLLGLMVVMFLLMGIVMMVFAASRRAVAGLLGMSVGLALMLYACGSMLSQGRANKPTLKVRVKATGAGWDVTVKGDADPPYRILLDGKKVGSLDEPGTITVADLPVKPADYRPQPVREFKVVSKADDVSDKAQVCAPVVFISARGTNENVTDTANEDIEKFHQGLGDRGWRTWQKVQAQLGLPVDADDVVVSAHPVRYPAILGSIRPYVDSRDQGRVALSQMWGQVLRQCKDSRIVLLGYSQGADVVASAWMRGDRMRQERAVRAPVTSVVLFADPHFAKKWQEQGVTFPVDAKFTKDGMLGSRRKLTEAEIGPLQSWCLTRDTICQKASIKSPWHGPEYECYEDHAAFRIAGDIAPALREQGYGVQDPTTPTCTPAT